MRGFRHKLLLAAALAAAGCTTLPEGPSVMAMPGSRMSFEQFRADDRSCRQYAYEQIGGRSAQQAGDESIARSAVAGTAIGAVAGAALGGDEGAAAGAATGLLFGTVAGANAAGASSYSAQQRYDNAYVQCMYAQGHRVPVYGSPLRGARPYYYPPPPPPGYGR